MSKKDKKKKKKKKNAGLLPGERCDSKWVEVRRSGIHGRGVFATKAIPPETYVIQYVGEKITKSESNRRGWAQMDVAKETGDAAVYIFTLNKRYDIDGNVPENAARLINHSCDPNCEAYIVKGKIWIASVRGIAKDEEISFNYNFDLECYEDHPCRCGSEKCIGYIAGEEYWPELKRKLAAKEGWKKRRKKEKKRKMKAKLAASR